MGWSISCMTSLCLNSSSADQSTGRLAKKTLAKFGPSTKALFASGIAVFLSGSHILVMVGFLWWLVSPLNIILALFHASLVLNFKERILSYWLAYQLACVRATSSFTPCCWSWICCLVKDFSPLSIPRLKYRVNIPSLVSMRGGMYWLWRKQPSLTLDGYGIHSRKTLYRWAHW